MPPGSSIWGRMYEEGRGGLPRSEVDAVAWYGKAADQGQANAHGAIDYRAALKRYNGSVVLAAVFDGAFPGSSRTRSDLESPLPEAPH
jgi:TPR repeat protein